MTDYKQMAELLFPDIQTTVEEVFAKYPKRNLKPNAQVTRYAPSPTGYMHIGNFFQAFISYNLARISDGIFIVRTEDTDAKREKQGAMEIIFHNLDKYGLEAQEYQRPDGETKGDYGPYIQTLRPNFYKVFIKKLVSEGKAFPCFCRKTEGKEEIMEARETKFIDCDNTEYDACRNLTLDEVKAHLDNGDSFAIRLKTNGDGKSKIKFYDLIKGEIEAQANAKDVILLKSDGIPPYTFAHIIDDTLMGVTIIVRGEEYISSTPVHLEIINALGFNHFTYCHNPLICKIPENGKKRKISKRYDPEADMRFYSELGYPIDAPIEYLLNLISSKFEPWRNLNPNASWKEFKFAPNEITTIAPIFDMAKLKDISKNIISKMSAQEVYSLTESWAKEHNEDQLKLIIENKERLIKVLEIGRGGDRPRKDIAYFSEVVNLYNYVLSSYSADYSAVSFENVNKTNLKQFLEEYMNAYTFQESNQEWFENLKNIALKHNFVDNKTYKLNPEAYAGNVSDATKFVRIAITGRTDSPELYSIMKIIGEEKCKERLNAFIKVINA